jgi:putative addiction module component (TIGR02574 family)
MAVLSKAGISALSLDERLALIDDLWESLDEPAARGSADGAAIPEWQQQILDERLLDLEQSPAEDISLAEAREQSLP